jgi:predicted transcriptional regulator
MSPLTVRLPKDIERRLDKEAELTARSRSDLVREAVGQYLTLKERERLIEEMKTAHVSAPVRSRRSQKTKWP